MFARLVGNTNRHIARPNSQRAYSYLSSKSDGGGKYFTSTKPPNSTKVSTAKPNSEPETGDAVKVSSAEQPQAASNGHQATSCTPAPSWKPTEPVHHLPVTPHDLNLHNFFSLHRPLLLISQPTDSLFERIPAGPLDFVGGNPFVAPPPPQVDTSSFDEAPEASPEADADAARLLSRGLVVNRLGSAVNWEDTMAKLGLDMNEARVGEQEALMGAFDAYMDSTKRKRKKKMKKHKYVLTLRRVYVTDNYFQG